jgi:hypothetical protein
MEMSRPVKQMFNVSTYPEYMSMPRRWSNYQTRRQNGKIYNAIARLLSYLLANLLQRSGTCAATKAALAARKRSSDFIFDEG